VILIKQKSDYLGSFASGLCLIHCIATPFLFITQAGAVTCCDSPPTWWRFMDYFFITLAFFAIFWSTKTTTINWMKPIMWFSWLMLLMVILNEKFELFPLAEAVTYVPAFALIILHFYNNKHCKCSTDKCCVNER